MLEIIVIISILGVFYAYLGYPLMLMIFTFFRRSLTTKKPPTTFEHLSSTKPSISIIIAARNEEEFIKKKLDNTLSIAYGDGIVVETTENVQVIVASDCCDDSTDALVRSYSSSGVKLVRSDKRKGKEYAQSLAVQAASGSLILFTDTKTTLKSDALEKLIVHFEDSTVGAISSIDEVECVGKGESGEGVYVKYEMWLRVLESKFNSLIGLSGSAFAVRREFCRDFRTDIPSDLALLISVVKAGYRGVLAQDVVCSYKSVASPGQEFARKIRTVLRGITTLFACREVLNPYRFRSFAWQIASHKLARWLVPVFLITGAICVALLAVQSLMFFLLFLFGCVGLTLAGIGYKSASLRSKAVCKIPLFLVVSNLAICVAWWHYLRGRRSLLWTPSAREVDESVDSLL